MVSSAPSPYTSKGVLLNVQGLRGLAALMVALCHSERILAGVGLQDSLSWGGAGVAVFFVISGFIMVRICRVSPTTPMRFMIHRIKRVMPLYWLMTTAVFVLVLIAPALFKNTSGNWIEYVKSLLFIPFRKGEGYQPMLFVGWSLNLEMFFYVIFAFSLNLRSCAAAAMTAMTFLTVLVGLPILWPDRSPILALYQQPIMLDFVAGMGLALIYPAAGRLRGRWAVVAASVLVAVGLAGIVARVEVDLSATSLTAGVLWFERLGLTCKIRAVRLLGDSSYSLYLLHPFILLPIAALAVRYHLHGAPVILAWLVAMVVTVFGAVVCYLLVEKPVANWLKGRFEPASGQVAVLRSAD
jgi:exopolysaccharide production protein ExoZ